MSVNDDVDLEFWGTTRLFMERSARGEILETDGLLLVHSGIPIAHLNQACVTDVGADLVALSTRAVEWYGERKLPFSLAVRSDWDLGAAAATLRARGWLETPGVPAMRINLDGSSRLQIPERPGLEIRRAETDQDLADFSRVSFNGFGFPEAAAKLFHTPEVLADPNVISLLGLLDGTPMCTSMAVLGKKVSGIYWVATLEQARGRGLGESITWAAVEAARMAGSRIASLQASEMGRPVYSRMGFDWPYNYARWIPPGQAEVETT